MGQVGSDNEFRRPAVSLQSSHSVTSPAPGWSSPIAAVQKKLQLASGADRFQPDCCTTELMYSLEAGERMRKAGLNLRWHSAATYLSVLTIIVSLTVAYLVNGSFVSTVRMVDLRSYGGTTFEDIRNFELWRIAFAQMLHSKMPHMLFNAACLYLLGRLIEDASGGFTMLAVWLVAGGAATVLSPILVDAPWNVGTGASQAVFAFAGFAAVFAAARRISRTWSIGLIALAVIPGVVLDLLFAGYPKPGHVAGLIFGALFGFAVLMVPLRPSPPSGNAMH